MNEFVLKKFNGDLEEEALRLPTQEKMTLPQAEEFCRTFAPRSKVWLQRDWLSKHFYKSQLGQSLPTQSNAQEVGVWGLRVSREENSFCMTKGDENSEVYWVYPPSTLQQVVCETLL